MDLNHTQAPFTHKTYPSPDGPAKELTAYAQDRQKCSELAQRILIEYPNHPCVQKTAAFNQKLNSKSNSEIPVTPEEFVTMVEYRLLGINIIRPFPLSPLLEKKVLSLSENYILELLDQENSNTFSLQKIHELSVEIYSYVDSLITGKPQKELRKNLHQKLDKDCLISKFIHSNSTSDTSWNVDILLEALTDPSKREMTCSQFKIFCAKQKQAARSLSRGQLEASMRAELADLLEEDEQIAAKKSTSRNKNRESSSSPNLFINTSLRSPNLSPNPGSFGSNPLNKSFNSSSQLDRSSQSPSPNLLSPKRGVQFDPFFDSRPGVKKVPIKEKSPSNARLKFEHFLNKIQSDSSLPTSVSDHVSRWSHVQSLDEVRAFTDLSLKGDSRYAKMNDLQITRQILQHDATSITSLLQSELFRTYYLKSASDRHHLLKVKLELPKNALPEEWTVATIALSEKQELVHFYCHDVEELKLNSSNGDKSLISMLFPVIQTLPLKTHNATSTLSLKKSSFASSHSVDIISEVPQEKGPPLLKVLRQHPLTGPSILWIAPIGA